MIVRIRTNNFNLVDGSRVEFIEPKLKSLESMFRPDTIFDISISKREKDYKCEIKVQNGRDFIRSEETGASVVFSVDNAVSELKKRVRKVKSMRITKKRGNSTLSDFASKFNISDAMSDSLLPDLDIERRKYLLLDVLTEEEAVLSLESLNHSFFIFKNKDISEKICVIYRRSIGYGLLETD